MDLAESFLRYREKIVNQWVDYTLNTYKSSEFFLKEKDKFANPIGAAVRIALEELFDLITSGAEPEQFRAAVDKIVRIRAVQEFTPAQAVAPLNAIKHITREVLTANEESAGLINELYDFEFAVDLVVLAAFDLYMESRERLYQVRMEEIKSGSNILTDSKCPSKLLNESSQEILKTV